MTYSWPQQESGSSGGAGCRTLRHCDADGMQVGAPGVYAGVYAGRVSIHRRQPVGHQVHRERHFDQKNSENKFVCVILPYPIRLR